MVMLQKQDKTLFTKDINIISKDGTVTYVGDYSTEKIKIHHAAAHDNLAALEIIYSAYKEGINDTDRKGRLPIHVAAEFDAVDTL